ncbi:PelD GGDEF domain-containing protein [Sulfurimonas microaerophilic]|uniref:PelD GGDEF domain-containing protein n=1 Tax=Sulfurimonas microaerophilic TaxID=3058392 RepID=UPI00271540F4|nr:PelD GGDEF domain-containing protein [Sulfurimonas sp. hsl 1-7]
MAKHTQRVQEKSTKDLVREYIHKYAYIETLILVTLYVAIGYLINSEDPCLLSYKVPYLVILLAVITLFHGFENGVFAVSIISLTIWIFYPSFQYVDFLIALLMTLIFSQFHYYWTSRIKEAEVDSSYKSEKLSELSRAFYTLKISHDQLEKNYVIKPMSIRNSINHIVNTNEMILLDETVENKAYEYNNNFLKLIEKSFSMQSGLILYLKDNAIDKKFNKDTVELITINIEEHLEVDKLLKNYLVDKAIARKSPVYVSDETGEPTIFSEEIENKYIGAIPAVINGKVVSVLVIEKMPFMFFNRENLTSITILHEYFSIENRKASLSKSLDGFELLEDKDFKFEMARLRDLNNNFKVNSVVLVLRIDNELQTARVYQKVERMLRSLDMITLVQNEGYYYITLLLPLHDKAAAQGFLKRLQFMLEDERDKKFEYMSFDMSKLSLLSKYYREDYGK